MTFRFTKPDGTKVEKGGNSSTPSEGKLHYTVEDGFIDQEGEWRVQGYVEFGSSPVTKRLWSDIETFPVASPLPSP